MSAATLSPLLAGIGLAIFLVAIGLGRRGTERRVAMLLAPAMRAVAVILVAFALCGVGVERPAPPRPATVVAIVDGELPPPARRRVQSYLDELAQARPVAPSVTTVETPRGGSGWLAEALTTALEELPPQGERHIVVFSAGREVGSRDIRALHLAQRLGVTVSAVPTALRPRPQLSLSRLRVPPLVFEGDTVRIQVWAKNRGERPMGSELALAEHGEPIASRQLTLEPGTSVLEIPYRLDAPHVISVYLTERRGGPPAGRPLEASLAMAGKLRVMVITPKRRTLLGRALRLRGVEVEFRRPAGLPRSLEDLIPFRCLVLSGVPTSAISAREVTLWRQYVRDFGGSIVVLGGRETFRHGRSALAAFLPLVPLAGPPPQPRPDRMAVVLLVDRSNSMGDNSLNPDLRDGQKLRFAKAATIGVIDQLRDDDLVGVLAFDTEAHVVGHLAPLHRTRELLRDRVARLQYGGSTDFYSSLELAYRELRAAAPERRHIILLTDGANLRPHDYEPLLAKLRNEGITATTIRIGTDEADLALLRRIAGATGGTFHHIADAVMLPQVVLRDAAAASKPRRRVGARRRKRRVQRPQFFLHVVRDHPALRGIDPKSLPAVPRFAPTRARGGAEVILEVDTGAQRYPLVALQRLGLGRVVAIAAPVDRLGEWAKWQAAAKFWSQLVRTIMRTRDPVVRATGRLAPHGAELRVEVSEGDVDGVSATVVLPDGSRRSATLEPAGARRYHGSIPEMEAGTYAVHLVLAQGRRRLQVSQLVRFGRRDRPGARRVQAAPAQALAEIAAAGGGTLDPPARSLAGHRPKATHHVPLDPLLVPIAAALVLADIAVRELW